MFMEPFEAGPWPDRTEIREPGFFAARPNPNCWLSMAITLRQSTWIHRSSAARFKRDWKAPQYRSRLSPEPVGRTQIWVKYWLLPPARAEWEKQRQQPRSAPLWRKPG